MKINELAVTKTNCQMLRIGNPFVQRFPGIRADFQTVQPISSAIALQNGL